MNFKLKTLLPVVALLFLGACTSESNNLQQGAGQIKASFKANYNVRSTGGESESMVEVQKPDIADFGVRLVKSDGSFDRSWSSIAEFPTETKFTTGDYNMEIYYGDLDDEGFEKPYYYGSGDVKVLDEETSTPEITARLANAMVSVAYTDAFKQYFTDYSARIHSAGGEYIDFAKDEERAAYVKPGNVSMTLTLTKQNGTTFTFEPTGIANALAATHYHVTFDVNNGEVGDAVLSISFDDATVVEPVNIVLSDELMNAPAPTVVSDGFVSGTALNILAGDGTDSKLAANVMAISGINSVTLTTESEYLLSKGWPAELDLMKATAEQKALLESWGLKTKGLWVNPDKIGIVDFAGVLPNLRPLNGNSTHKFTIQVKDNLTRVCDTPVSLVVNTPTVLLSLSAPEASMIGSTQASFAMYYSGTDVADNLSFKVEGNDGTWVDATLVSATATGDNTYKVVLAVPDLNKELSVKAVYRNVTESNTLTVPRTSPEYSISTTDVQVWGSKAGINLNPTDAALKATVTRCAALYYKTASGEYVEATNVSRDAASGIVTINGLTPGTQYTVKCTLLKSSSAPAYSNEITFTTEKNAQLGNGNMDDWNIEAKQKTGIMSNAKTYYTFHPNASGESDVWWDTNNDKSQGGTLALGIWYQGCFASCVSYTNDAHTGKAALIYVSGCGDGYANTAGTYVGGAMVGSLFIGSYNSGIVQGHSFSSRPASMSFWYKYAPYNSDAFKVVVSLKNGDTEIASGTFEPVAYSAADGDYKQAKVDLTYSVTNMKATTICVQFLASNKTSLSSSDFAWGTTINYPEIGDWQVHMGSVLKIDDITLNY